MGDRQQNARHSHDRRGDRPSLDLGTYVGGLGNAVYKGIAAEVAPYDLSPLDVQLMMICREMRECTATRLAQLLPVDASRVSRLVTGLADKGLLRRRRLRSDRRIVMLRLTPAGEQMTADVSERMQVYYARLTEGFSEHEMRAFSNIAQGIVSNYEAMEEP